MFTEEQIIGALTEADVGARTADLARRLSEFESENAKLTSFWQTRCWTVQR
jgi:hypothetical protein